MEPYATVDASVHIASLRYTDARGAFASGLWALGMAIPGPLRCVAARPAQGELDVFAWRSPTETVWICRSARRFEDIGGRLAPADDGCLVDQSNGRRLIRLRGPRAGDLLARLGSGFAEISAGTAKVGRMADTAVLACKPGEEETLLVVDRLYLEHFLGFLSAAAADR